MMNKILLKVYKFKVTLDQNSKDGMDLLKNKLCPKLERLKLFICLFRKV